jgi:micrococcal nuclease
MNVPGVSKKLSRTLVNVPYGRVRPAMFHRNRFRRRRWRRWVVAAAVVALVLLRIWQEGDPSGPNSLDEGPHAVARVIDGDTILLANHARVRLLGADSPETKHPSLPPQPWGAEATDFTRAFIGEQPVRLAFDRELKDKYGRFLAYVYVDDRMLNEELLRAGLARALLQYPYSDEMKRRFQKAEAEAKAAKRGIWSATSGADGRAPSEYRRGAG